MRDAQLILTTEFREARHTLLQFGIECKKVTSPAIHGETRPYFATLFNSRDLDGIEVLCYETEVLEDRKDLKPTDFKTRVRAGFREEIIHALQILSTKERFNRLANPEKTQERSAGDYYKKIQRDLFNELASTPEGQSLLVDSGRLYYADPTIQTVEDLREYDITYHRREGYITVELTRQLVEIRLGVQTSEENRGKSWDKGDRFKEHAFSLESLAQTIKTHAPNPRALSPLMGEVIEEIETLQNALGLASKPPALHALRTNPSPTPPTPPKKRPPEQQDFNL